MEHLQVKLLISIKSKCFHQSFIHVAIHITVLIYRIVLVGSWGSRLALRYCGWKRSFQRKWCHVYLPWLDNLFARRIPRRNHGDGICNKGHRCLPQQRGKSHDGLFKYFLMTFHILFRVLWCFKPHLKSLTRWSTLIRHQTASTSSAIGTCQIPMSLQQYFARPRWLTVQVLELVNKIFMIYSNILSWYD